MAAVPTTSTKEGEKPQKKFYRSRAHCNPLSHNDEFSYPPNPSLMNWTEHYPNCLNCPPDVLDVGCGFGGLTVALSPLLPNHTILGLEIRPKIAEYVRLRIAALRVEHPGRYENCSALRSNTMKHMPHFFHRASILKMFFCFPDPHFKRKNHPRRIISERLLSEYAFFLKPDVGRLYCITDVEDLHDWHMEKCRCHPLFRELSQEEMEDDPCVKAMINETEEGKKVERSGVKKHYGVFERVNNSDHLVSTTTDFFDKSHFGVMRERNEEEEKEVREGEDSCA